MYARICVRTLALALYFSILGSLGIFRLNAATIAADVLSLLTALNSSETGWQSFGEHPTATTARAISFYENKEKYRIRKERVV